MTRHGTGAVLRLDNPVRTYAWGSRTAIPALLGRAPDGTPQAELWIGAHERAGSRVGDRPLSELIAADPAGMLGPGSATARLPYLAKVIAVDRPLSLQVHPDAATSARGYAAEEAAGIPRSAARRNFPDDQAKTELVLAVSPFRALGGLRDPEQLVGWLDALGEPALQAVRDSLADPGPEPFRAALRTVLLGDGVAATVRGLSGRLGALAGHRRWGADARLLSELAALHPEDPAMVLAVLMSPQRLEPGEALLIRPGQPHTYLSGLGFEVQVNSDNVLRGGLTRKHTDLPALLAALRPGGAERVRPRRCGDELVFDAAAGGFALSVLDDVPGGSPAPVDGPQLYCSLAGTFTLSPVDGSTPETELGTGDAVFVPAAAPRLRVRGSGRLVRVTRSRAG